MTKHASHPATFALGGDHPVSRLGFGAMRLAGQPGNFGPDPDWAEGLALLRREPSWAWVSLTRLAPAGRSGTSA